VKEKPSQFLHCRIVRRFVPPRRRGILLRFTASLIWERFPCLILLVGAALPSLADVSGTVTLQPDNTLDLSTGSLVSSYPDLRWDGSILRVQVGAVLVPSSSSSSAANLFATMTELDAQNYLQNTASSLVNSITPVTNTLFVAWTNSSVYYSSKILVTALGNGSITLEYYTYDYTTGPPAISGVQNNSNIITVGYSGSAIAPSSIIVITGSRLSDPNVALQLQDTTQGLPLTLNGTSLSVAINGTTVQPAIYYATPTQIAAELPAATPAGSGTITVSHGGFSASAPIQIVPSAYGIDTMSGSAVAQDAVSYALITYTASAQPGEFITLWGTGLGTDPADSDTMYTTNPHAIQTPVEVYVGNVQAGVLYSGASVYPGVDVILFTIPEGAPNGCAVPIAVVTGESTLSNTPTLPIMNGGGVCSDPRYGTNGILLSQSTFNAAMLSVYEIVGVGSFLGAQTYSLDVMATMQQVSPSSLNLQPSLGGCIAQQNVSVSYFPGLDAGAIRASGDGYAPVTLTPASSGALGSYVGTLAGPVFTLAPPAAGTTFTFNASGGAQVGPFTASVNYPNPTFGAAATVGNSGLQVTWSSAADNSYVLISASASTRVGSSYLNFALLCAAAAADGQFTVPAYLLLGAPTGTSIQSVGVSDITYTTFSAMGLDLGLVTSSTSVNAKTTSP